VTVGVQSPSGRREGLAKSVLRGFPITAGLAAAFVILLVTVPALRVASMVRGRRDTYVPLVTTLESYPVAAGIVLEALERHGIAMPSDRVLSPDTSPSSRRTSGAVSSKPCYIRTRCCSADRTPPSRALTRSRSRR